MCGVPAVTTDAGSAAEVVLDGTTGYVTPREPQPLADAVLRLLADSDLSARLGANAREHAESRFGTATLIAQTQELYETAIAAVRGPRRG